MEEFEKRMVIEYHELDKRTDKLDAFLNYDENADKRKDICVGQLAEMHKQLDAMKAYRKALSTRLQMRGICFNGFDLYELKGGLELFKKLPRVNKDWEIEKYVLGVVYTPILYQCNDQWIVEWRCFRYRRVLREFVGKTPEEAIIRAYTFYKTTKLINQQNN